MAVTPFKTFSAGEILTASDLNSSLSQVFDNGEDLAWPSTKAKDFNGTELILDADGDSSITADTDDQIDFKLAGTDIFRIATVASAVNAVSITGAATGSAPTIAAFGSDATLNLDLSAKGEATVNVAGESLTTATIFSVAATALTTGTALDISGADALTTGKLMNLYSNSSDTGTRELVTIYNDNSSATSATCLELIQDAAATSLLIDQNGNGKAINVSSDATTSNTVVLSANTTTTAAISEISGSGLTTGKLMNLYSNSSDTGTRELVTIRNDNSAATGTSCLELIQDASFRALLIDNNGSAAAVDIDTAGIAFDIDASLTSASVENLTASSASYAATTGVSALNCNRTASTAYSFLVCTSDADGTPDTEFRFRGDGEAFCDGSFTGGGADYAEFFEWLDGNPTGEDRRGVVVELVGDKIKPATSSEKAIGVISARPTVVGDAAWNQWHNKYLKDDFGDYVMEDYDVIFWDDDHGNEMSLAADRVTEDVKVPEQYAVRVQQRRKLNPDWDPDASYTPRADRKEWALVGMAGKLRIGKGQPTAPGWRKMRDISDNVEEWLLGFGGYMGM